MRKQSLSNSQARRVALAAQGFAGHHAGGRGGQRPDRTPGMRDVQAVINRLAQFQIDTINIVARAHYLPLYSRLGPYDPGLLDRALGRNPRRLFEYWGHAASAIDITLQPALRFRMAAHAARTDHPWATGRADRQLDAWVLQQITESGPLGPREIDHLDPDHVPRKKVDWGWNWSDVKVSCERLFNAGVITPTRRNGQFERTYDLVERVLPQQILQTPTPPVEEAMRQLVRRAAAALGVASEFDLRDYFRTSQQQTQPAIRDLVDAGELIPVSVEGWSRNAYLWHQAKLPRSLDARSLVSPFDSVMFERDRLERLFEFFYRIEIYVPEPKRVHGYYVYPFLLGDRFVARVDLKADRAAGVLRVNAAWLEDHAEPGEVGQALAAELRLLAEWLGLEGVVVGQRGDFAQHLNKAVVPALAR
ncbi:winged helix-turn-helix domain-containing protein [Microlunatus sp. Gsoil 973]|uniref:winged helix-turn-helix domain-containing protein n=1 Tax=Microlunatus sp. Gsoil 973 TaxID=2672569 RepID=UPI001E43423C|nr:crosslink repair DNA glycosylase YcaQ family protein [Microlunatus sp. Gsoil 973]